jgi:hypothetical protein
MLREPTALAIDGSGHLLLGRQAGLKEIVTSWTASMSHHRKQGAPHFNATAVNVSSVLPADMLLNNLQMPHPMAVPGRIGM